MGVRCLSVCEKDKAARTGPSKTQLKVSHLLSSISAAVCILGLAACSDLGPGAWDIIGEGHFTVSSPGTSAAENGGGSSNSTDSSGSDSSSGSGQSSGTNYVIDTRETGTTRIKLALNGISDNTDIADFPLLVHLRSGSKVYNYSTDGTNLAFRDADGYSLPYEMESWTQNGDSYFWVKIRSFKEASSDFLYIYFLSRASDCANYSDAASVWSNGYIAVWHGALGSSEVTDSLGRHPGISSGTSYLSGTKSYTLPSSGTDGHIGGCLSFAAGSSGFAVPHTDDLDSHSAVTIEFWARFSSLSANKDHPLFYKGAEYFSIDSSDATKLNYSTAYKKNGYCYSVTGGGAILQEGSTWEHIAVSWQGSADSDSCEFFKDGTIQSCSGSRTSDTADTLEILADDDLIIGNRPNATWGLKGDMDEIRLSNVARSADWMLASFKSQQDSSSLPETEEAVP